MQSTMIECDIENQYENIVTSNKISCDIILEQEVVAVVLLVVTIAPIVVAVVLVAVVPIVVAVVLVAVVPLVVTVVPIVVVKFSLTLPWVVLFSGSGLYQSPGSLRTRRRTCAVPRRALLCSSTSLIVPGIWASQPDNLSAIAPSAPTTTGITMILTFHSCSSSIFND